MDNLQINENIGWSEFDSTNLAEIHVFLESINEQYYILLESQKLIMVYGYIIAPLAFIVVMSWWVFRQFIYKN